MPIKFPPQFSPIGDPFPTGCHHNGCIDREFSQSIQYIVEVVIRKPVKQTVDQEGTGTRN